MMAKHFFFVELFDAFCIFHKNALLSLLFLLFEKKRNHLANNFLAMAPFKKIANIFSLKHTILN